MFVDQKKRTTKVHPRTGALSSDKPSVAGTDLRSLQSVSKSLSISPDHSIRDSSNEATDSLSPGLNGGVSYKSKTMRDTATASAVAAESTNDIETSSTSKKSSPSKKRGTNPNAKPFVMTVRSTGATAGSVTNTSSSVATHREGYQLPPRIRKRDNGSGFAPHCPTVGQVQFGHPMPQGQGQGHRISDEQLNAQGFNPAEFGSHDDQIMDDEEDHGPQTKGKDRRSLFKTELCREYSTSGWCYYNKRCSFAHGLHELRPVFRSKKWRSKRCRNWHTTGYCPYEHRYVFAILRIVFSLKIDDLRTVSMDGKVSVSPRSESTTSTDGLRSAQCISAADTSAENEAAVFPLSGRRRARHHR